MYKNPFPDTLHMFPIEQNDNFFTSPREENGVTPSTSLWLCFIIIFQVIL
jgi:hypothetical protein